MRQIARFARLPDIARRQHWPKDHFRYHRPQRGIRQTQRQPLTAKLGLMYFQPARVIGEKQTRVHGSGGPQGESV